MSHFIFGMFHWTSNKVYQIFVQQVFVDNCNALILINFTTSSPEFMDSSSRISRKFMKSFVLKVLIFSYIYMVTLPHIHGLQ